MTETICRRCGGGAHQSDPCTCNGLRVGEFDLRKITVPSGSAPPFVPKPAIWIEKDDGEGMSVDEGKFAALVRWYFKENF